MILPKLPFKSQDKTLETAWRMTLSLLIFAVAVCALTLLYCTFFAIINTQWQYATGYLIASVLLGCCVIWLCNNRNDIVGSI